jgi:hypothetical protein
MTEEEVKKAQKEVTDNILYDFLDNITEDSPQYKVIMLMVKVLGSKETIVRLLRLLLQGQEFSGDNHINVELNMPLTICGECGEFVHNGMACSNPECTGDAETVYTSKKMLHGLLSVRSRKRILK